MEVNDGFQRLATKYAGHIVHCKLKLLPLTSYYVIDIFRL